MSTTWSICAFRKKQKKKALDVGLYCAHQQKCGIHSSSTSLSPSPRIAGIVSSNAHVEGDRNSLKDRTSASLAAFTGNGVTYRGAVGRSGMTLGFMIEKIECPSPPMLVDSRNS